MEINERAVLGKWGIGKWSDLYIISTPWFVIVIADPAGARCLNCLAIWTGFEIYYKYNPSRREGDVAWLKQKRIVYSWITYRELEEWRCRNM